MKVGTRETIHNTSHEFCAQFALLVCRIRLHHRNELLWSDGGAGVLTIFGNIQGTMSYILDRHCPSAAIWPGCVYEKKKHLSVQTKVMYWLDSLVKMTHTEDQYIDGLVQECSNSVANALELLPSCSRPSIFKNSHHTDICVWICAYVCIHPQSFSVPINMCVYMKPTTKRYM